MLTNRTQPSERDEFARSASAPAGRFFSEFWYFLRHNRKWWLTPVILLLLFLSVLIVLGGAGAAPFIYTLF